MLWSTKFNKKDLDTTHVTAHISEAFGPSNDAHMHAVTDRVHILVATDFHAEFSRFFELEPRKKAAVIKGAENDVPGERELLD